MSTNVVFCNKFTAMCFMFLFAQHANDEKKMLVIQDSTDSFDSPYLIAIVTGAKSGWGICGNSCDLLEQTVVLFRRFIACLFHFDR